MRLGPVHKFPDEDGMAEEREPWTLTARWLFPVSGPPLERGTITIEGDHIVAVEPQGRRHADLDLGNAAILPGLVNAHTHLDLSGMRGLAPPSPDFTAWLRQVIAYRRSRPPEQVQADIRAGLEECLRLGTTLVGDIASEGASWDALAGAPLRAVVYRELLGLPPERAEQALASAKTWLETHPATATCRSGLSPHAPYSVRHSLFARSAWLAWGHDAPLAVHLAESREELELLRHRRGPLVSLLCERGVWSPGGLVSSPTQVMRLCKAAGTRLFIHGNYLSPGTRFARAASLIYCPRTHAAFGHPPHPWREFLKRGVRVALGTDSLASNPDLDLLAEARFLHQRHPDVPGEVLLRMATLSGAEALGWADQTGSLEPGKSADLVVVPLPDEDRADPHALVLGSAQPVRSVLWRGQWVSPPSPLPLSPEAGARGTIASLTSPPKRGRGEQSLPPSPPLGGEGWGEGGGVVP
ncbi:MAG TPA: amidohydrolase family protein [Gemmataceae bacterium]|nr:amidohydrolase family protein [Gemmataceae bacterium]